MAPLPTPKPSDIGSGSYGFFESITNVGGQLVQAGSSALDIFSSFAERIQTIKDIGKDKVVVATPVVTPELNPMSSTGELGKNIIVLAAVAGIVYFAVKAFK